MSIDFARVEALTFDCYGTIIDWESGILTALGELLGEARASAVSDEELLSAYARFEAEAEHGRFQPYRDVLREVARAVGTAFDVRVEAEAVDRFAGSVVRWPPFDDSIEALRALANRYRLAIVSNVDDDLFAGSAERLGIDFAEVVTAQQVGSYKPAPGHFHEVLRRLDLPKERVLHCAQSLFHDIAPAKALGFTCVWVDRRAGRAGSGATPPATAEPDLVVSDLKGLARAAGV